MSRFGRPPRPGARTGLRAPLFLLRYPFVALARRTTPILFKGNEGGRAFFLNVGTTAPASGLPLHTDADILIAATTATRCQSAPGMSAGGSRKHDVHVVPRQHAWRPSGPGPSRAIPGASSTTFDLC